MEAAQMVRFIRVVEVEEQPLLMVDLLLAELAAAE
tara:strand:+ start:305 stop:409 length:105 start_codon:yes stop_codon:yes gene_type:complete